MPSSISCSGSFKKYTNPLYQSQVLTSTSEDTRSSITPTNQYTSRKYYDCPSTNQTKTPNHSQKYPLLPSSNFETPYKNFRSKRNSTISDQPHFAKN